MASLTVGRVLSSLLYQVNFYNPIILLVSLLLLATTVLLASYLPARRAASIEPMLALRAE